MSKTVHLNLQKNIPVLVGRSDGVRAGLVASRNAGRGAPNEVVGNEREVFVRGYLEVVYPRAFRFSSGFIIDSQGGKTGQLDIIVEKLGSLSLPASSQESERLHFAEMVSAVISVKSNISSQWSQVEAEARKLKGLKLAHDAFFNVGSTSEYIPFFVVAYSGPKDYRNLKIDRDLFEDILHGVIILDERTCWVKSESNNWVVTRDESSFLRFIANLHDEIATKMQVGQSIWKYICEIEETD